MRDDGGAAFPLPAHSHSDLLKSHGGMSLRDYFAGQALAGLIAQTDKALPTKTFAQEAYLCADAMIVERCVPNGEAA